MGNDEQMSSGLESLGAPKRKKKKKIFQTRYSVVSLWK